MHFSVKGSGDISAYMTNAGYVKCDVLGSGVIKLSGVAKNVDKTVRGSGFVETMNLQIR